MIWIQETGSGIPPEDLPYIFERGFTNRPDGTGDGLGLNIVCTIALEHSGMAEVKSQPGQGSIFTLSFPIAVEEFSDSSF